MELWNAIKENIAEIITATATIAAIVITRAKKSYLEKLESKKEKAHCKSLKIEEKLKKAYQKESQIEEEMKNEK